MTANVENLRPAAPALEGCLDAIAGGKVFGWAWNREHPSDRLVVEVLKGDTVLASAIANLRRADLAGSGIGEGDYAFEVNLPDGVGADEVTVQIRSPEGDKAAVLELRPPPQLGDLPNELQRVNASMHGLALVQRQTAGAVQAMLRELREGRSDARSDAIEERLNELAAGQKSLALQVEGMEVFLMRFDGLLRQLDEKMSARPPQRRTATLRTLAVFILVLAATATATALIL